MPDLQTKQQLHRRILDSFINNFLVAVERLNLPEEKEEEEEEENGRDVPMYQQLVSLLASVLGTLGEDSRLERWSLEILRCVSKRSRHAEEQTFSLLRSLLICSADFITEDPTLEQEWNSLGSDLVGRCVPSLVLPASLILLVAYMTYQFFKLSHGKFLQTLTTLLISRPTSPLPSG